MVWLLRERERTPICVDWNSAAGRSARAAANGVVAELEFTCVVTLNSQDVDHGREDDRWSMHAAGQPPCTWAATGNSSSRNTTICAPASARLTKTPGAGGNRPADPRCRTITSSRTEACAQVHGTVTVSCVRCDEFVPPAFFFLITIHESCLRRHHHLFIGGQLLE
jgi:hypothetical protein